MANPYETLDTDQTVVTEQGKPTPYYENFVFSREIRIGSGSPEGVVTGYPTQLYMDSAGSSGSILYIKKTGTGNTGWIAV